MPPLRRHLRAWLRRGTRGQVEAFEALGLTCAVRLLLYITPFRTLLRWMRPAESGRPMRRADICRDVDRRNRIARAVGAVGGYVPQATCLTQSIVVFSMLKSRGYSVALKVGVVKGQSGKLEAHAWVEDDDGVCLPGNHPLGATLLTLHSITESAAERVAHEPVRQSP